jgi:Putative Actinobacterial Holin-X, holin superfamily III
MAFANQNRSIADLLRDVIAQLTTLLRKEAQLARVELSENLSRAAVALGVIIAGAVLLIPALIILLEAAVAALEQKGMVPAAAAGIVGGAALLLGFILVAVGALQLRMRNLMPNKTIQQLQHDAATAKQQMRHDYDVQRAA